MARKLDGVAALQKEKKAEKHTDLTFGEVKTTLDFIWDPYLNSSFLPQYLKSARPNSSGSQQAARSVGKALVVLGGGLWFAKDLENAAEKFKETVDLITSPFPHAEPALHMTLQERSRLLFIPVQPPNYSDLSADHKTMQPDKIQSMNEYMADLSTIHDLDVVTSFLDLVKDGSAAYEQKGIHVVPNIADVQADILLNLRCNNDHRDYPYDSTCCYQYARDWPQTMIIGVGVIGLFLLGWVELQGLSSPEDIFKWNVLIIVEWVSGTPENAAKRFPVLRPLLVMWAGLFYCYLADRTHLFNKVHKQYDIQDFVIFCIVIALTGGLSIRQSVSPQKPNQEKPSSADQPFLSRDQTDEWKGWMQVLILTYHYTGASKVLWIYKIIRLLVASYLFMTGYGHAAYFYQKSDFSLKRSIAVLIRLNLLSCLLPWTMRSDYLFYYFAPLVTYWYAIVWLTMRIKSDWNQRLPLFLLKVATACAITTVLHMQQWAFGPVFTIINAVFGSKWDAREWLFRAALDQYIVYIGMIVSVLYIRATKPPPPPPPPQGSMATTAHTVKGTSPHLRRTLFFVSSAAALTIYVYASNGQINKTSSNKFHPYLSPLPILAFIHLRNCTRRLRNHYSGVFAWVGRISLETFILQYHIWLAADTKGLLSLGLFGNGGFKDGSGRFGAGMGLGRWADCVVLGMVFVWVSSKVAGATGSITSATVKALFS